MTPCECGCGALASARFIHGHNARRDAMERFLLHTVKGTGGDCWLWVARKNRKGYGEFRANRKGGEKLAHRYAYAAFIGPIPSGLCVLHRCDVPACVNPAHLFLGTLQDNNADMRAKGRHAKGERSGQTSLTADQVGAIKSATEPQSAIAHRFNVHQSTVSRIKRGLVWA